MPNPDEVATIDVAGGSGGIAGRFNDWKSVWVQHRWADSYPRFQFTAAEREEELPEPDWRKVQLAPGDSVAIYLGRQLAITGMILQRQVAHDADNHAIQISGVGRTWAAARASILHKDGNFDGKTFMQVAEALLAPTGVKPVPVGTPNPTPFVKLQVQAGAPIWDFLENIARPRGIIMGSDHKGNILIIGEHSAASVGSLIEGVNIKKMQCVISIENTRHDFRVRGQVNANDQQHGTKASEQESPPLPGSLRWYSPLLVMAEQPVWSVAELTDRARAEVKWNEGTIIHATITVVGWQRPDGALWVAGQKVYVKSPMAMLDMELKIQTATFTQDRNSGTETTLECYAPWLLNDRGNFNVGRTGAPQDPAAAKAGPLLPASTPPAAKVPDAPPDTLPPI
jgi:prophage tail gpP-like protein